MKKLSILTATILTVLAFVLGVTSHQPVYADAKSNACQGVGLVTGTTTTGCGSAGSANNSVSKVIAAVVNILSIVVGVAAVIMIIIGGLRFVMSGGDSNNTNAARNSILYAIVGLVIVALAQVIVHFVLSKF